MIQTIKIQNGEAIGIWQKEAAGDFILEFFWTLSIFVM